MLTSLLKKKLMPAWFLSCLLCYPMLSIVAYGVQENENTADFRFEDKEELILTFLLDKYTLGDSFSVVNNGQVSYDFESFLDLLDFPIKYNNLNLTYSGWYIREDNTFSLSPLESKPVIYLAEKRIELNQGDFLFLDDVFYLNETILTEIFGIAFTYDFKKLQARLMPKVNLPILERLAREQQQINTRNNRAIKHPYLSRSYELLSPQTLDFNMSNTYSDSRDNVSTNYSISGARDIALMHTEFSLVGNADDLLTNSRVTFSREDESGGLLGFLGATQIQVGDIRPVRQANGASSQETRGLFFSNSPLNNLIETELTTLAGDVPLGWDVQLFRNGILLNQLTNVQTGRYEFVDVPLLLGQNTFELALFGPQGQVVRRQEKRLVDRSILQLNKTQYSFSINDASNTLLGIDTINPSSDLGYNVSGVISSGIADTTVLQLGYQGQFGGDLDKSSLSLGLNSILWDNLLVNFSGSYDDEQNAALGIRARTNVFEQSIAAEYRFSDSLDDQSLVNRNDSFILTVDGALPLWGGVKIPYQNQVSYSENGLSDTLLISSRFSIFNSWVSAFNTFQYTKQKTVSDEFESKKGSLSLQKSFGRVYLRYSNLYNLDGAFEFLNHKAELNWTLNNHIRSKLTFTHNVQNNNSITGLQLGWFNDKFQLFGSARYSDNNGFEIGLNTRFSLAGSDSSIARIYQNSRGLTNSGSIAVRVFDDFNMNAKYDEGEQILEGVKVQATQLFKHAYTNDAGIAMLTGLTNQRTSDIELDRETLPDPYLYPLVEGVSIKFRRGSVDMLDFPMTIGSEIEGIVSLQNELEKYTRRGLIVELVDKKGQIVKQTATESDGFYIFEGVVPGHYQLRVNDDIIKNYDVTAKQTFDINVTRESELIDNMNFDLPVQNYKDVYLATLGTFSNKKSVDVYKVLLIKKIPQLQGRFFIDEQIKEGKQATTLNVFYSLEKDQAEDVCKKIQQLNINCEISSSRIPTI